MNLKLKLLDDLGNVGVIDSRRPEPYRSATLRLRAFPPLALEHPSAAVSNRDALLVPDNEPTCGNRNGLFASESEQVKDPYFRDAEGGNAK